MGIMSKYIFGGLGLTSITLSLQPFITAIKPYWLCFFIAGLVLFFIPAFQWLFRNKKFSGRCNSDKRIQEYILKLKALKENIAQLRNPPSEFRPKVPKTSNAFLENMLTAPKRKRYNDDAIENISLKYNSIKEGIKKNYPKIFKGLSKNTKHDTLIYDIEYLLSIFKSMQRPKE